MRAKFIDEHTHGDDDEVRFIIRGGGAFYLHVAHRLGLPSGWATGVGVFADPLGYWVDRHKVHHRSTYRADWRPTIPAGQTLDEFLRAAT